MERSVSGLFTDGLQADNAVGAVRADGIEAARITVASPDGAVVGGEAQDRQSIRAWLVDHLLRRGHPHEQAQRFTEHVASGGWLVSVTVRTDDEDGSVRNLLVTAGAKEISGVADGKMIQIDRADSAGGEHP